MVVVNSECEIEGGSDNGCYCCLVGCRKVDALLKGKSAFVCAIIRSLLARVSSCQLSSQDSNRKCSCKSLS